MDMFVTSYGHAPVLKLTLPCSDAERFAIAPEWQGYVHAGETHITVIRTYAVHGKRSEIMRWQVGRVDGTSSSAERRVCYERFVILRIAFDKVFRTKRIWIRQNSSRPYLPFYRSIPLMNFSIRCWHMWYSSRKCLLKYSSRAVVSQLSEYPQYRQIFSSRNLSRF